MTERQIIEHTVFDYRQRQGVEMPLLLEQYLVDLLWERLRRVDIIPEPSFAERYLELYSEIRLSQFKDYADSALFFTSLMPNYGDRRGLNWDYYATLGISAYYALADLSEDDRYVQLGNWFYVLREFLDRLLHNQQVQLINIP